MFYAFIFSFICFALSCVGAACVFFVKNVNEKLEAFLYSFAGGVMVASGIFSLIIPAIDYCKDLSLKDFIILPICFLLAFVTQSLINFKERTTGINISSLTLGIALHNVPEGMCVGFAFASAAYFGTHAAFMSAIMIAIGIGIQNIPEGSATAFPICSIGKTKRKAFLTSMLVGFVEVPAAIIAYLIGLKFVFLLPYMLAFAAGIMINVAVCDLMPEAISKNKKHANLFFFLGFLLMMTLDLALG